MVARAAPCKICGTSAPLFGVVDFNKNCTFTRRGEWQLSGIPIFYFRCDACDFTFATQFDAWQPEDFARNIYNAGYAAIDPDYLKVRPANKAQSVVNLFAAQRSSLSVLDYGGGNGQLAANLAAAGFRRAETYDPFTPEFSRLPTDRFDLVTCFEVMEHVPDPVAVAQTIAGLVVDDGLVLFSTLVQPANFLEIGLQWPYAAPRNGHISLYSRRSLERLWAPLGFTHGWFDDNMHVAFRKPPAFAAHLIAPGSTTPQAPS